MFLNIRSKPNQDMDPHILEKLNADANTTVMKLTRVVAAVSCVSLTSVEFFNHYDTSWLNHVAFPVAAIIIASAFPFIMRRLRIHEAIITHSIAIIYLLAISIVLYAYNDVAGLTAWAVILILVIVSMCYFSNSIVLAYSFVGGIGWLAALAIQHPSLTTQLDMTDHVGRLCIFIIVFGMALWVNRKLKREVFDNYEKMVLIRQYTEELEAKNIALSKLDLLKDEFLANTTHELRTPLHGIIGLLEPLAENNLSLTEEEQYTISLAILSARRLSGLVGDILDFSKLKNSDIILTKRPINLHMLTQIVCKTFEIQIRKKGIGLINEIAPNSPPITADENRFLQVMYNLIGNAVKFTGSGEIRITAEFGECDVRIAVSDTGIGIPESKQRHIFKAFEQADSSISREYGGTGLGLAITKSLVELHQGTLQVSSQEGVGSTFCFTLPRSEADAPIDGMAPKPTDCPDSEPRKTSREDVEIPISAVSNEAPRILVVDDEPVDIRIIQTALAREGYCVICAHNGKEALELIQNEEPFDLVLLDVMMPYLSGYEVCQTIRKTHSLTQLPVIMITARGLTEDLIQGFESGANDYLRKPFDNKELLARVGTLVDLRRTALLAISAELFFLQSQIKPHFLHNTLSTIIAFVRTDPDLARELLTELSNYLRESFNFNNRQEIMPIAKEISLIQSYLFIEQARYSDKLNVLYEIDERLECNVPHLILQPIVENAVRHGILPKLGSGTLRITAKHCADHGLLCVEDDGVGIRAEDIPLLLSNGKDGCGIALFNVQKRMQALYGHGVQIHSELGKGTRVSLKIPLKEGDVHDSSSTGRQRETLIG